MKLKWRESSAAEVFMHARDKVLVDAPKAGVEFPEGVNVDAAVMVCFVCLGGFTAVVVISEAEFDRSVGEPMPSWPRFMIGERE